MRIEDLQREIGERAAFLVTSPINRVYLTGFRSSAGVLVLTRKQACFLTDFRYIEGARRSIDRCEVRIYKNQSETLTALLKEYEVQTVICECSKVTLAEAVRLEKCCTEAGAVLLKEDTLDKQLERLRVVKSQEELEALRQAQSITDSGFTHILEHVRPGVTERQLAWELESYMRQIGAERPSFDFIIASGVNSAMPHASVTNREIQRGDFVTMDFGVVFDGYCSDMTRTVAVGYVTEEQQMVYEIVLKAQKAAIATSIGGAACAAPDKAARQVIEAAGYGDCFGHSTGHGAGLELHEAPVLANGRDEPLLPGMVVTAEPGIYIENRFGVRIEDMLIISEKEPINLTKSPKSLIILD